MNTITSKHTAIIDGKSTGLSGCNGGCQNCLRASPLLAPSRVDYRCAVNTEHHSKFVAVATESGANHAN